MSRAEYRRGWKRALVALLAAAVCGGCGRQVGPARFVVSGRVTYAGKPVAAGRIAFEPDPDRGNKGPAGYGDIVDGRYVTYPGRGVVGGPQRVVIEGYAGSTPQQQRKRMPLFPPHVTTADLPHEKTAVDFSVPTSKAR